MGTALLEPEHAADAEPLVHIQPAIDSIGVGRFQEAAARDGMRRLPIGHLQQGGTALTDLGPRVVITVVDQVLALRISQG